MALPPLSPTPHLSPLLAPEEEIIYTPHLHPLHGIGWFLLALLCLPFARLTFWALLPAIMFFAIYLIPFRTNQIAITTHRLLFRLGRFKLVVNDIQPDHINHWQFHQNPLTNVLGGGLLILNLNKGHDIIPVRLPMLSHPMRFLEALGTLNPNLRGHIK